MRLLLLLLFCTATLSSFAGSREQIVQVLSTQNEAWNRGDIPAFMQGYWQSDSLQFVSKKGITRGWRATLERYQKSYPDRATMGLLTFSELQVRLLRKRDAIVVGRWFLKREKGDVGGYFTLVMKKMKEGWRIVIDHTS